MASWFGDVFASLLFGLVSLLAFCCLVTLTFTYSVYIIFLLHWDSCLALICALSYEILVIRLKCLHFFTLWYTLWITSWTQNYLKNETINYWNSKCSIPTKFITIIQSKQHTKSHNNITEVLILSATWVVNWWMTRYAHENSTTACWFNMGNFIIVVRSVLYD